MDRLFIRGEQSGHRNRQIKIAVTGLGRCTGTTLAASSLAFFFEEKGNSVSFVQCAEPAKCNGLLYDSVAMDKRFYGRDFVDFYESAGRGEGLRGSENLEAGISWILVTPENVADELALTQVQKARLISAPLADICIYDVTNDSGFDEFMVDMDVIIVVVDPMPSVMTANLQNFRRLKAIEASGALKLCWLISGINSGVSRRQVRSFIKSNHIFWAERVPAEVIYGNEYRCRFHWESEDVKAVFSDVFTKLSHYITD